MVAAGIAGVTTYGVFTDPNRFTDEPEKTIFVSHGQTFASVADSLQAKGIIRSRLTFRFVEKVMGGGTRIQSGKYLFRSGISNIDLLRALREGKGAVLIPVTLAEGLLARTQAQLLSRQVGLDSAEFVRLVYDESFAQSLGIASSSLEGYLMPDTYNLYWQPDAREVIHRMVERFKFFFNDSLQARMDELGWTTNEVVTLASIVEGETALPYEMTRISGVYHNRLRKGMRLQADPTIQFMIDDGPRRILHVDLLRDDPYNTYRRQGLPPGPVNNPGRAAILAALYPENHRYLFFVANRLGGHSFSTNFAEHTRNVRMYKRRGLFRLPRAASSMQDTTVSALQQ